MNVMVCNDPTTRRAYIDSSWLNMANSAPKYTHHKVQMNHDYEVKFTIKDGITDELVTDTLQNVYAKGISAMPADDDMFNDIWRLTS